MISLLRKWIRGFFGFSRTETNAFLILIPLMLALVISPTAWRWWFRGQATEIHIESHQLDSVVTYWQQPQETPHPKPKAQLVISFDPNKVSLDTMQRMGFSAGLAKRIDRYRAKGGKFRSKKEFRKMFSRDSILFIRLADQIQLPEEFKPVPRVFPISPPRKMKERFDLNKADTTQLIALRGIGSKLSQRITQYRDRLGGFVDMTQLEEIYGLDSVVLNELRLRTFIDSIFVPQKININKATMKELMSLPYLRFPMAKSIVAWRFQHGPFEKTDDLHGIDLIDDLTFQKIKPYLVVKD